MTMNLQPLWPHAAIVMAGLALLAMTAVAAHRLAVKEVPRRWIARLTALRVLAVFIFLTALWRPVVRYERRVAEKPDLLVLVDDSASMSQTDAGENLSRMEQVQQVLRRSDFAGRAMSGYDVYAYAWHQDARPVGRGDWRHLKGEGERTQLADGLRSAWLHYRQQARRSDGTRRPPARVLLVTDGNDMGGEDPVEAARRLGPVVDVLAPHGGGVATNVAPGIEMVAAQTPGRVLLGSDSRVSVTLRRRGDAATRWALTLIEEDEPILRQELRFEADQVERRVTLAHRPTRAGLRRYALKVEPENAADAQAAPPYAFTVRVDPDSREVLVLDDHWRWEFKFLRRVLESDPHFNFTGFLARRPGIYAQFAEPDRRVSLAGFPQGRFDLNRFDIIVLGDVNPTGWPRGFAAGLREAVVDDGRSLVILAGPGVTRLAREPELHALLPVELGTASGQPLPGPVAVRVTTEGASSPIFFDAAAGGERRRWGDLPPFDQIYPVLRKRAGATILLEAAGQANEFGPLIVAAEHTVGRGRVLFIATDTLWKWQMIGASDSEGQTPYQVFWRQALRALQAERAAAEPVGLWVQTDRSRYTQGQNARLRAEIEPRRPLPQPTVEAVVTGPDGRETPLALERAPDQPLVFTGAFEVRAPGAYRVKCTALSDGKPAAEVVTAFDAQAAPGELPAPPPDLNLLERLATATGGRLIDADDPATWPEPSTGETIFGRETVTIDWAHTIWILAALTLVLGADWLIRLMKGFV